MRSKLSWFQIFMLSLATPYLQVLTSLSVSWGSFGCKRQTKLEQD